MYQEKAKRWGSSQEVKQAIADKAFMNLMQLSDLRLSGNSKRSLVELFYAESANIVYFMIKELGEYRFVSFCRRLKEGDSFEEALHGAYGRFRDVEGLNRIWEDYLKK